MTSKKDIGLSIKNMRQKAGLKQKELAKKIKPKPISVNTISRVERGEYNYSIDLLFKIAEVLECDISDFCSLEKTPKRMSMFEGVLEDFGKKIIEEERAKYKK